MSQMQRFTRRSPRLLHLAVGVLAAGAALSLGGCRDATGPQQTKVSAADAKAIADFVMGLDQTGPAFPSTAPTASMTPVGAASPAYGGTFSFNATRDCPGGGTRSAQGKTVLAVDTVAHTATLTFTSTHAYDACVFTHDTVTTQLDGSITSKGETDFGMTGTRWHMPQITSFSGSRNGSLTRTVNGNAVTCDISLTSSYDASTRTLTVSGTVCGRQVDYTRTSDGGRHR